MTGEEYVGGLIGSAENTTITDSFATGSVTSTANSKKTGGVTGYASYTSIKNCCAACRINRSGSGLVNIYTSTTVTNSYFDRSDNTGNPSENDRANVE